MTNRFCTECESEQNVVPFPPTSARSPIISTILHLPRKDMGLVPSKSLSTWERHVCCAPREEVSGPVMAPVINASTLSDKMPAHCTWEMLEARYAQLLEHQYTRRPLRLDVADGCADASAQQGSLPVRCMARNDGVAARTTHKSRLGSYHMLAECRRAVRDMQALKAERDTLREQKKEDLPSIFLPPLPTIEVAPGADVDLFCCFVPLPGMQSEHRSVSLASGAGEACVVAAQLGRISAGCHGRVPSSTRWRCEYPWYCEVLLRT